MKRVIVFVLTVASAACAKATRPGACNAAQEEYAVISTILQQPEHKLTVTQQVTDDPHFASDVALSSIARQGEVTQYREQMKKSPEGAVIFLTEPQNGLNFPPELTSDYQAKNAKVCLWDKNRVESRRFLTWDSETSFPRDADEPDRWWQEFRRRFGSKASAARFSRVGFDSSGKRAVVHMSSGIAKNAAGGTLYYLEKSGYGWAIKFAHSTWTT